MYKSSFSKLHIHLSSRAKKKSEVSYKNLVFIESCDARDEFSMTNFQLILSRAREANKSKFRF